MNYRLKNFEEAINILKMNEKLLETITSEHASSLYGIFKFVTVYRGNYQRSTAERLLHSSFML